MRKGPPLGLILAMLLMINIFVTFLALNKRSFDEENPVTYQTTPILPDKPHVSCAEQTPSASSGVPIEELVKGPLPQNDSRILSYIRNSNLLVPPSVETYNLEFPIEDPSMGQSSVLKTIFKNMEGGFFVECGALDGETRSNTLNLEMNFGWTGLLIEGNPKNFEQLQKKNRKAWLANACLAIKPYPHEVFFKQEFNLGKIAQDTVDGISESENEVRVQCFPLFSLLSALNVTEVDYFSLDVEGHEFQVLQTIPFDKILIKVLSVEYIHDVAGEEVIERFMSEKGYRVVTKVTNVHNLANDIILVHKSVKVLENIRPIKTFKHFIVSDI